MTISEARPGKFVYWFETDARSNPGSRFVQQSCILSVLCSHAGDVASFAVPRYEDQPIERLHESEQAAIRARAAELRAIAAEYEQAAKDIEGTL